MHRILKKGLKYRLPQGHATVLTERFLQTRTDRIIALARLAIALIAVGAVWLEPSEPAHARITYAFLFGYVAFAAASVLTSRRQARAPSRLALIRHLVDIAVIAFLVASTEAPVSPFFVLFTFVIVSATLRWRWKGALWTSAGVLGLLLMSAAAYQLVSPELPLEPDRLLIRCAHIAIVGGLLVYFGFHQERMAEELARLNAWQADPLIVADTSEFLSTCAAHAAEVFTAPRVLIVLSDPEEPSALAGLWDKGQFHCDCLEAQAIDELVPPAVANVSFMQQPETDDVLVAGADGRIRPLRIDPVAPILRDAYAMSQILSAPIRSERAGGRLFVLDQPILPIEDLMLAGFVASQIGAGLDRMDALDALRRSTAVEERLRLARDLHDGALQTLAATALQLESLGKLADRQPGAVASRINALQEWLLGEQRQLRVLIQRLRPAQAAAAGAFGAEQDSQLDLLALKESLQHQWGMSIGITREPEDLQLTPETAFHIHQLIREAAANAARHGSASELSIALVEEHGQIGIKIADNGSGMPQHGVFTHEQCAALRIGPRSLRERVLGLGGSIVINSSRTGLSLDLRIPVGQTSRP
ncbi:MAG TPA: histidine kinase [Afifellaceae bacterium]|nr:histidine kinase [Afifellaceae bacterium]